MKKLIVAACLYLSSGQQTHAQFYGHIQYSNPGYSGSDVISSSAVKTSAYSTGYLAASYVPSPGSLPWHLVVRKTDLDGGYSTADEFHNAISIYNSLGNNCTGPNGLADNCAGVSAIETNIGAPTNGSRYALVATMSGATAGQFLVFLTLNQSGTPVNYVYYNFPVSVSIYRKPYIVEDASSPGNYYICGSYVGSAPGSIETMYVLKVNISGGILWSRTYICGLGIEPKAIIKSPFNANEIAIVGFVEPDPAQAPFLNRIDDGFFIKLNTSNGNVNLFRAYGGDVPVPKHQHFTSIAPANSTYGGSQGFVIGGVTQRLTPVGSEGSWMLKVSNATGAVHWSTIVDNGGGSQGEVTGIFERFNAGVYTYFGGASMTSSVRAIKLDNTGTLFTGGSGNNIFDYNWLTPSNTLIYKTQLTHVTGTSGDGFQLFSTDGTTGNDNYFVKAYFDGNSGCSETLTTGVQSAGPSSTINPAVTTGVGLTSGGCPFPLFFFDQNPSLGTTANMSFNCSNTSILGASNLRQLTTQLEESTSITEDLIRAYPNPNNGVFYIESEQELSLSIFNHTGQLIKTSELTSDNKFKVDISGLSPGIYFIKAQNGVQQKDYKIIITK